MIYTSSPFPLKGCPSSANTNIERCVATLEQSDYTHTLRFNLSSFTAEPFEAGMVDFYPCCQKSSSFEPRARVHRI
jgi:hypothetical protein